MSNAEEKSSKASTDMLPFSSERNRSLTTFACVHHEKGANKSLIIDICINNAIFSSILKDDKDDDNFILVSNVFQRETSILEIENFFFCVLAK